MCRLVCHCSQINSYALHSLGPHVELIGGHARFGAVYFVGAFTGTLASYIMTPAPSLGASGEVACGCVWYNLVVRHMVDETCIASLALQAAYGT